MSDTQNLLRDTTLMQALLHLVIPPSDDGKLPGAGDLGIASAVAKSLASDPEIEAGLRAVQKAARDRDPRGLVALSAEGRLEVLESQLGTHPTLMSGLTRWVYPAYYQHPRVLEGLGQPGRPPFPGGFEVEETAPDLLEILRARARKQGSG